MLFKFPLIWSTSENHLLSPVLTGSSAHQATCKNSHLATYWHIYQLFRKNNCLKNWSENCSRRSADVWRTAAENVSKTFPGLFPFRVLFHLNCPVGETCWVLSAAAGRAGLTSPVFVNRSRSTTLNIWGFCSANRSDAAEQRPDAAEQRPEKRKTLFTCCDAIKDQFRRTSGATALHRRISI